MVAAVSTSGLGGKLPGRVGDSAIFGSGLHCEAGLGAAVATGDGDCIALFPLCFVAVQAMRTAPSVDAACAMAIAAFLADPNVRAFVRNRAVKNRLSDARGPLVALCGVSALALRRAGGAGVDACVGGACCDQWRSEFVMSAVRSGSAAGQVAAELRRFDAPSRDAVIADAETVPCA